MYYKLSIKNQIIRLFEKKILPLETNELVNDQQTIADVNNAKVYKEWPNNVTKNNKFQLKYTFTLNSDGVSLCEKSKLSIWPVYLAINELPIGERFQIDNIILARL